MKSYIWGLTALCFAGIVSSCIDDDYDLANIDTTVRVEVKDLTIPVNLDEITLKSILSLKEDSKVKEIDGVYAVVETGDFHSSPVKVDAFTLNSSAVPSSYMEVQYYPLDGSASVAGEITVEPEERSFTFTTENVPSDVVSVDELGGSFLVKINLKLAGVETVARAFDLKDLTLQLPKGLHVTSVEGGTYDPNTGMATIPNRRVEGNSTTLTIQADRVDFNKLGAHYDYANAKIDATGKVYLKQVTFGLNHGDLIGNNQPTTFNLSLDYSLPSIDIDSFSGTIKYNITGVDISPVSLTDLPDVLSQPGTDIRIANPQVYLRLNNPVQQYGVNAQTGLTLTGVHNDGTRKVCTLDDNYFTLGTSNPSGLYNYCISPTMPDKLYAGYEGAQHVKFTSLSNILSGNDIPSSIEIELDNPCVPQQHVNNFLLGQDIASVNGEYTFFAPLALNPDSKITYTDQVDGWSSEDLDAVTITKLTVTADITSDLPIDLDFTGYPIDVNGNQINNVTIEGAHVSANAQAQALTLTITGEIRKLDGIRFVAVATSQNADTLRPDIKIVVSKVRPVATGYYEKEL